MDVMAAIESRRSIRKFQEKPVPGDVVEKLLRAGQLAPSRCNLQHARYIVIDDPEIKQRLYEAVYKQRVVLDAPLLITVLGLIDPRKTLPDRTRELVSCGAINEQTKEFADQLLLEWITPELKSDAALNSAIAMTQITLAAHSMGLGSCWIKLCEDDKVMEVLEVPPGYFHCGILAVGFPDEQPKERPRYSLDELVSHNRFGQGRL